MRRAAVFLAVLLSLAAARSFSMDAAGCFDLGLKSTVTSEKIEYFTRALELDPALVEAYRMRGMLYYYKEKYDLMIADYHSYIELGPAQAKDFVMLGVGYLKSGAHDTAIRYFKLAVEMDPTLAGAYAGRAEAYRLMGNYDEALNDCDMTIKSLNDPKSAADALRTRSRINRELGKGREAYEDYIKAYEIDPRLPKVWVRALSFYNPEKMRVAGLVAIIVIALVFIFRLKLKPPEKDD